MFDFIAQYWGQIYTLTSAAGMVVIILLGKTYAKRDDLTLIAGRVGQLEQAVSGLPSQSELHKLQLEISELRGELREVKPELRQARRLADLLLENELAAAKESK